QASAQGIPNKKGTMMPGELFGETHGKRIVSGSCRPTRSKAEVSFEDSGQMLGADTNGFGTYTAVARPDGTLYGKERFDGDPGWRLRSRCQRGKTHFIRFGAWCGLPLAGP